MSPKLSANPTPSKVTCTHTGSGEGYECLIQVPKARTGGGGVMTFINKHTSRSPTEHITSTHDTSIHSNMLILGYAKRLTHLIKPYAHSTQTGETLLVDLHSVCLCFGQLRHGAVVKHHAWKTGMDPSSNPYPGIFLLLGLSMPTVCLSRLEAFNSYHNTEYHRK